ncbi:MAG: hypothetical protein AB1452_06825 [Pseudomonadota bacterium]
MARFNWTRYRERDKTGFIPADPRVDYSYSLTDEQLRLGLARTPLQRLQWLERTRRAWLRSLGVTGRTRAKRK